MGSTILFELYQYDSVSTNRLNAHVINDTCYGDIWQVPIGNVSGKAGKYLVVISTESIDPIKTHVEIELNRFLYFVPHTIMISSSQSCSVNSHTSDTCTASAPSSAGSMTGIISAHSDQSTINWHETLSITKICHYHMAYWTALWLPVFLINVTIFFVVFGAIQMMQYKQIQKKLNEVQTDTDSEPLLTHEANNNNYGSNTVTVATDPLDPTGSHSADTDQPREHSDAESRVHEAIGVVIEQTSDHDATTGTSDPVGVVVQTKRPPSGGDTSTEARPTFESGSAIQRDPSPATASIESILDSRDGTENIERNTADDTRPIIADVHAGP